MRVSLSEAGKLPPAAEPEDELLTSDLAEKSARSVASSVESSIDDEAVVLEAVRLQRRSNGEVEEDMGPESALRTDISLDAAIAADRAAKLLGGEESFRESRLGGHHESGREADEVELAREPDELVRSTGFGSSSRRSSVNAPSAGSTSEVPGARRGSSVVDQQMQHYIEEKKKAAEAASRSERQHLEELRRLLAGKARKIEHHFREWDADGNGSVNRREWRVAMQMMGIDADSIVINKLFDHVDEDRSGEVELSELVRAINRPLPDADTVARWARRRLSLMSMVSSREASRHEASLCGSALPPEDLAEQKARAAAMIQKASRKFMCQPFVPQQTMPSTVQAEAADSATQVGALPVIEASTSRSGSGKRLLVGGRGSIGSAIRLNSTVSSTSTGSPASRSSLSEASSGATRRRGTLLRLPSQVSKPFNIVRLIRKKTSSSEGIKLPELAKTDSQLAVNERNRSLMQASLKGDVKTCLQLLDAGADMETKDKTGRTPLCLAIQHKHSIFALVLLSKGARADVVDSQGNSPLTLALARSNLTMIVFLMAHLSGQNGWRRMRKRLTKQQLKRLHDTLADSTHVTVGRSATLIFLTSPATAVELLVRASRAVIREAAYVKRKDPTQAAEMYICGWRFELAVAGILQYADVFCQRRRDATSHSPVVVLLLHASSDALRLALRWNCKLLLSQSTVQIFLKHEWRGLCLNTIAEQHYKTLSSTQEIAEDDTAEDEQWLEVQKELRRVTVTEHDKNGKLKEHHQHSISRRPSDYGSHKDLHEQVSRRWRVAGEPMMRVGCRVQHKEHGDGTVQEVLENATHGGKKERFVAKVGFDGGKIFRYSLEEVGQLLVCIDETAKRHGSLMSRSESADLSEGSLKQPVLQRRCSLRRRLSTTKGLHPDMLPSPTMTEQSLQEKSRTPSWRRKPRSSRDRLSVDDTHEERSAPTSFMARRPQLHHQGAHDAMNMAESSVGASRSTSLCKSAGKSEHSSTRRLHRQHTGSISLHGLSHAKQGNRHSSGHGHGHHDEAAPRLKSVVELADEVLEKGASMMRRGTLVKHDKHGDGTVKEILENYVHNNVEERFVAMVLFKNGDTHHYSMEQLGKKFSKREASADEENFVTVTANWAVVVYALPAWLVQVLLLWVPFSLLPPLAHLASNSTWAVTKGGYVLDSPCLKFYGSFVGDVLFFGGIISFVTQSSWMFLPEDQWQVMLFVWAVGILINEAQQAIDKDGAMITFYEKFRAGLAHKTWPKRLLRTVLFALFLPVKLGLVLCDVQDMLEAFDLLGPTLAVVALSDHIWGWSGIAEAMNPAYQDVSDGKYSVLNQRGRRLASHEGHAGSSVPAPPPSRPLPSSTPLAASPHPDIVLEPSGDGGIHKFAPTPSRADAWAWTDGRIVVEGRRLGKSGGGTAADDGAAANDGGTADDGAAAADGVAAADGASADDGAAANGGASSDDATAGADTTADDSAADLPATGGGASEDSTALDTNEDSLTSDEDASSQGDADGKAKGGGNSGDVVGGGGGGGGGGGRGGDGKGRGVDKLDTPNFILLAFALLLLGLRMLRALMMVAWMGPLILMINKMLRDVGKWLIVQLVLLVSFAAALTALSQPPSPSSVFPDSCDLVNAADNEYRFLHAWVLLLEAGLMEDAQLECARNHSSFPEANFLLMVLFQLISAIVMLNMLIALMAKTFDNVYEAQQINFMYLRAQTIFTWIDMPPAPPPFNLLSLPFHVLNMLVQPIVPMIQRQFERLDCIMLLPRDHWLRRLLVKPVEARAPSPAFKASLSMARGDRTRSMSSRASEGPKKDLSEHLGHKKNSEVSRSSSKLILPAEAMAEREYELVAGYDNEEYVRRAAEAVTTFIDKMDDALTEEEQVRSTMMKKMSAIQQTVERVHVRLAAGQKAEAEALAHDLRRMQDTLMSKVDAIIQEAAAHGPSETDLKAATAALASSRGTAGTAGAANAMGTAGASGAVGAASVAGAAGAAYPYGHVPSDGFLNTARGPHYAAMGFDRPRARDAAPTRSSIFPFLSTDQSQAGRTSATPDFFERTKNGLTCALNTLTDFAHDAVSTITGHDDHQHEPFGNDDTIWGDMPKLPADQYEVLWVRGGADTSARRDNREASMRSPMCSSRAAASARAGRVGAEQAARAGRVAVRHSRSERPPPVFVPGSRSRESIDEQLSKVKGKPQI